jgi:hypothetical protein
MQQFYKGRTNNHLTWVMVDATDFATPESALSAAMTIKIYGKLRGATGTNFVSSGTGSLTNDITHVGASATGIYTIALAKADLSDASAAWYDQYIIALSATGAARQTLVVDGGIDASTILAMSGMLSDTHSAAILAASHASDAYSAALLVQSRLSDLDSRLASEFSDLYSQVSDFRSDLASLLTTTGVNLNASAFSDIRSAIAAGPAATVTASDISDIASAVWANTIGARVDSRILVAQSRLSDFNSAFVSQLSDFRSDLGSFLTTTGVALNASALSDLRSAIAAGPAATVTASDISDIASAVWAHTIGTRVDSRILVAQSAHSDMASYLVVMSGILSQVDSVVSNINSVAAASPTASDIASKVWADTTGAAVSSRVLLNLSRISDVQSALTVVQSMVSDVDSALTSRFSNLESLITTTGVQMNASSLSDLRSAISAGPAATVTASDISDIASAVWAHTIGARVDSRVLVVQSMVSDVDSALTSRFSNLESLIGTTGVPLNASTMSDLRSAIDASAGGASMLSDIYSLLSDLHSDVGVMSGVVSDIYSGLATIPASMLSAAVANPIHANVHEVNDVSLVGNGTLGNEWGPA